MDKKELCLGAIDAMNRAYVPYSNCRVGAALLTESGEVFFGCNIENASFTPTVCAERTAFFKAISEGKNEFSAIAVASGKNGEVNAAFPPCGVCRQVMSEFCTKDFKILIVQNEQGDYKEYTLEELLPLAFNKEFM